MAGKIVVKETATGVVQVTAAGPQGVQGPTGPEGPQGDPGVVQSVVAGDGTTVDDADPANPIVAADAVVTASDPTTGRLAINGIEMGDTDEVVVDDTDLLNGWTSSNAATGLHYSRVGNTVHVGAQLSSGDATDNHLYTFPAGFVPERWVLDDAIDGGSQGVMRLLINAFGEISIQTAAGDAGSKSFAVSFRTGDPWPTTLPGT